MMIQSLGSNGYLSLVSSQIAHSITNYCAPGSTLVFGSIYSYMYLCYFLRAARSVSGFHAMIQCLKNMLGRRVLCWVVCTDVLQAFGATKCRTLPTQRLRHMLIRLAVNWPLMARLSGQTSTAYRSASAKAVHSFCRTTAAAAAASGFCCMTFDWIPRQTRVTSPKPQTTFCFGSTGILLYCRASSTCERIYGIYFYIS